MSTLAKLKATAPYAVVLGCTAVLWGLTNNITYSAQPGQLPPTVWPRVAITIMAIASLVEIARILLSRKDEDAVAGLGEVIEGAAVHEDPGFRLPHLLAGGVLLTLGFAVFVNTLGFLLATFIYLVVFMYLGRYRNHTVIWLGSLIGTLVFAVIFLKLVYVSLPRGTPPFDQVTQFVIHLLSLW
ncbi:MAG: tripartite tricarboxylate transporter TctB family protein [Hyphomicrobiaceae bacterium]|nr:tripartite tricarboxylate transporter TctB family protein [Hyphomicrobiaceae bacterium]